MEIHELKAAIEAVIFVSEEPVPVVKFKEIFAQESFDKIETALSELAEDYRQTRPGLEIREVAGGYRMTTRPEHHEWVRAYLKTRPEARLSLAALETLAVIAYRQPITLAEIMSIRGIKSTSAIRTLLEKKLITPAGRKKVIGRPILYGTTREFLIHFGLKDLGDLPTLEEFAEMIGSELSATPASEARATIEETPLTESTEESIPVEGVAEPTPGANDDAGTSAEDHR